MKQVYVITEGERDIQILKKLLPKHLSKQIIFTPGQGSYGAMSMASTLLAVRKKPVALVVDTDTRDERAIHEKVDTLRYLLRQAAADVPFEVLAAIPEIEAVFFEDRGFLERITARKFSDTEWKFAKLSPRDALTTFFGEDEAVNKRILEQLDDATIRLLQKHPLITKLSEFLAANVENGEAKQRVGKA